MKGTLIEEYNKKWLIHELDTYKIADLEKAFKIYIKGRRRRAKYEALRASLFAFVGNKKGVNMWERMENRKQKINWRDTFKK